MNGLKIIMATRMEIRVHAQVGLNIQTIIHQVLALVMFVCVLVQMNRVTLMPIVP